MFAAIWPSWLAPLTQCSISLPLECALTCTYIYVGPLTGGTTKNDALAQSNATFSLLLPGNILDLTALNNQCKFRDKGNKAGAKLGWDLLQQCSLGELKQKKARHGTDMVKHKYTKTSFHAECWGSFMLIFGNALLSATSPLECTVCSRVAYDMYVKRPKDRRQYYSTFLLMTHTYTNFRHTNLLREEYQMMQKTRLSLQQHLHSLECPFDSTLRLWKCLMLLCKWII